MNALSRREREAFDELFEGILGELPGELHELIEEAPVIIEDQPDEAILRELQMPAESAGELCGLHTGVPLTERSVHSEFELPTTIHLFRRGIIDHAGGWEPWEDEDGRRWGGPDAVAEEIRITLLHEIGHHFGLDEDDLARLGYD